MSDEPAAEQSTDSATSTEPAQARSRHSSEDRVASARSAFAEAMRESKAEATPVVAEQPEPDEPTPAWMDPEVARLRRELTAKHESLGHSSGPSFDDLLDRPGQAVRTWLESARGEKFATDAEFKAEVADLVTRLSSDELGVPLPSNVRTKLDAAVARKAVNHMKSSSAKRDADRAERDAHDAEWARATEKLNQHLAAGSEAAKAYPLLAAEREPGQTVIDIIRMAAEAGEPITWEKAAKLAESHLRRSKPKATPPRPAPAPAPKAPPASRPSSRREMPSTRLPTVERKWDKDAHRAETLAALRKAHAESD